MIRNDRYTDTIRGKLIISIYELCMKIGEIKLLYEIS